MADWADSEGRAIARRVLKRIERARRAAPRHQSRLSLSWREAGYRSAIHAAEALVGNSGPRGAAWQVAVNVVADAIRAPKRTP